MPHPNSGPFVFRNGFPVPISREEFHRHTRRHATASAAPRDPPTPPFDSRAFSRKNMLAQLERQGLPLDTAPAPEQQSADSLTPKLDSRARSKANMVAQLRAAGLEPVRRP